MAHNKKARSLTLQTAMFRKNPSEVEAVRFTAENPLAITDWIRDNHCAAMWVAAVPAWTSESGIEGFPAQEAHIILDTHRGPVKVLLGDWVALEDEDFVRYSNDAMLRDFSPLVRT